MLRIYLVKDNFFMSKLQITGCFRQCRTCVYPAVPKAFAGDVGLFSVSQSTDGPMALSSWQLTQDPWKITSHCYNVCWLHFNAVIQSNWIYLIAAYSDMSWLRSQQDVDTLLLQLSIGLCLKISIKLFFCWWISAPRHRLLQQPWKVLALLLLWITKRKIVYIWTKYASIIQVTECFLNNVLKYYF